MDTINNRGQFIGIIGSPGSGKTFLAQQYGNRYGMSIIYEDARDFPPTINKNLLTQTNLLETILWFRNRQIADTKRAMLLAAEGYSVILDTTIFQYQLYIDLYIKDEFYKSILQEMANHDNHYLPKPDLLIYIASTPALVRDYLSRKEWPLGIPSFIEFLSSMSEYCTTYIRRNQTYLPPIIEINRQDVDFEKMADIEWLHAKIYATKQG